MQNGTWLGMLITKQSSLFYWNHYIFSSIFLPCIWIESVVDFFSNSFQSFQAIGLQILIDFHLNRLWRKISKTKQYQISVRLLETLFNVHDDVVSIWSCKNRIGFVHHMRIARFTCHTGMGYDMICYDMTIVWYGWQAVAILWNVIKYKMWECGKRYKQACFGMIKTAKHSAIQPNYKDKGHFQWHWQQPEHIDRQRRTKQCHHITHESR